MSIRQAIKSINVLNILLFALGAMFISYIILPTFAERIRYQLPSLKKTGEAGQEITKPDIKTPPFIEYAIVSERYIFHPERKIPAQKVELPKPEFVLYGTLITDNLKLAYMEDKKAPSNTPGRGQRQTALKLGAVMSGFTLKEIHHDRVVMVRGEESISVRVTDRSLKKR